MVRHEIRNMRLISRLPAFVFARTIIVRHSFIVKAKKLFSSDELLFIPESKNANGTKFDGMLTRAVAIYHHYKL